MRWLGLHNQDVKIQHFYYPQRMRACKRHGTNATLSESLLQHLCQDETSEQDERWNMEPSSARWVTRERNRVWGESTLLSRVIDIAGDDWKDDWEIYVFNIID